MSLRPLAHEEQTISWLLCLVPCCVSLMKMNLPEMTPFNDWLHSLQWNGQSLYFGINFWVVLGNSSLSKLNIVENITQSYWNRYNRWHRHGSTDCAEMQPVGHHRSKQDVVIESEQKCVRTHNYYTCITLWFSAAGISKIQYYKYVQTKCKNKFSCSSLFNWNCCAVKLFGIILYVL